jgi:hypothetical protein
MTELADTTQNDTLETEMGRSFANAIQKLEAELGRYLWEIVIVKFKDARYTRPINFKELGINQETTKEELIGKGYSPTEADKLLFAYRRQQDRIGNKMKQDELQQYTIAIKKLGWINIDRFLDDPSCDVSDFRVQVQNVDPTMNLKVSLIIPMRGVCIESVFQKGAEYSFTQKDGDLRKLPIGEKAIITVLGYKDGVSYYAFKKISIPKEGLIEAELMEGTIDELKAMLTESLKSTI